MSPALVAGPQHGTLTQNADGAWTYAPDANWNGSDSFTYKVNDGELDSSPATVTLVVTPVNDAPVVAPRTVELAEDTPLALDLLAGASDVDGDALSVAITQAPLHGSLKRNLDGTWTYAPDADWSGTDRIEYQISDGTVAVSTDVDLVVRPVNDAPVAGNMALAAIEDTPLTFDLLARVTDIDSAMLTPEVIVGPQHGRLVFNADGSFTYTPDPDWNGTDSLSYKVSDGELNSGLATVQIDVTAVNDAPVANPISAALLEDGSFTLDLRAAASDVDGDALAVTAGDPQHGQLVRNADGSFTYRPTADWNGDAAFSYTVSDGQLAATAFVRLTITAVNDAPVAADDSAVLDEDSHVTLSLLANDYDVDGDPLTIVINGQPAQGRVVLNADNTVTYVPAADWSGEDSFTYRLSDGQTLSDIATVRLIVNAVADAPKLVLTDIPGQSRELFRTGWESVDNRNSTSTLVQRKTLEGWALITQPDPSAGGSNGFEIWSSGDKMMNAAHQLQTVSAAPDDGNNWLELNNSGGSMHQTLGIERSVDTVAGATYTLSFDYAGRIGYGADYTRVGLYVDGRSIGGYGGGSPMTTLEWQALQFSFTGTGGKQTIRIASEATKVDANGRGAMIDDIVLTEVLPANTGFEDNVIALSSISAILTDTDGSEALKVEIQALPVGAMLTDGTHSFTATAGKTIADITGWSLSNLSIKPPMDYNGSFTLKVVVTATEQANGNSTSTAADLAVKVVSVNDAPVATDAICEVARNGRLVIDFAELVSDVDSSTLALSIGEPEHGTLTRNADGTFTYVPKRNFAGVDGFSYTVSDGSLIGTGRISIQVVRPDGYGHDDDRDACIVVRSTDPNAAPVNINWNGRPGDEFISLPVNQPDWLPGFLGSAQPDNRTLAEITGLVVRIEE